MAVNKNFIIIEGIDGAGKGTVLDAIVGFLFTSGFNLLDLRSEEADLTDKNFFLHKYRGVITCEPTGYETGREIRGVILKNLSSYTASQVAGKFTEDRKILYQKVIIPALKNGLVVIQDRSFISTLVYQANQAKKNKEGFGFNDIVQMNSIALENPPGLVIAQQVNPETAYARLNKRTEKMDNTDFEKMDFLRINAESYKSGDWRKILEAKGTEIVDLDCDAPVEKVKKNAVKIIKEYFKEAKLF